MMEEILNNKWLKITLLVIAGLLLVGGLVWAGYWYGKNSNLKTQISKPQLKTQNLTPTLVPVATSQPAFPSEPTLSPAETAGWKTYTNTKYGYSVKYPINLIPREEPTADVFLTRTNFWDTANDTVVFGIEIRETGLAEAVEDLKDQYRRASVIWELKRKDKIVHQGYDGYRLEYESGAIVGIDVTVIVNNGVYSYLLGSNREIVDQIFSTFKFLD